jgi:hypothetical protein
MAAMNVSLFTSINASLSVSILNVSQLNLTYGTITYTSSTLGYINNGTLRTLSVSDSVYLNTMSTNQNTTGISLDTGVWSLTFQACIYTNRNETVNLQIISTSLQPSGSSAPYTFSYNNLDPSNHLPKYTLSTVPTILSITTFFINANTCVFYPLVYVSGLQDDCTFDASRSFYKAVRIG